MPPDLAQLTRFISFSDWLDVIQAVSSAFVAVIAYRALRNWQRQDRAKRQAEFLDALIEAMHAYIAAMSNPINLLRLAQVGIQSHIPAHQKGEDIERKVKGAVTFIQKYGKDDGMRIMEALKEVQPSVIKLRALSAKGQVFHFEEYAVHRYAIEMMANQFDRIEAFANVVRSPSYNWGNPRVIDTLKSVLVIDPDDMCKTIEDTNIVILKFVSDTYKRLYG